MKPSPHNDPPAAKKAALDGLDPLELLKQGTEEDTLLNGDPSPFEPLPVEELAPLFPQFEIYELIGKGGMGAVYRVLQKELDRVVALKILPAAVGQVADFSSRFTREARALAKLNHPGIVTIHDFGQSGDLYFILMEFVDGVNLRQLMGTGRISPREALAIVPQLCDALQFAHDQGIVHRDIKPENILLDRLGRVKIADFGLVKLIGTDDGVSLAQNSATSPHTELGKVMGTRQYMAPEQIDHPTDVDHRADIYGLGVVFYQLLTGELPDKEVQAPSKKVQVDVRLDEIVLLALEKDPQLRFQQISQMKTMVEPIVSTVENHGATKTEIERPSKRNSIIAITLACSALLLVIAFSVFPTPKPSPEKPKTAETLQTNTEITIQVLGEANRPSNYQVPSDSSLLDAIAIAGGWTEEADIKKIMIKQDGKPEEAIFDLEAILNGTAVNPVLAPNSTILINKNPN